ncbi:response regulator receiver protein [Methylocella silvestris BL2]|uniref:Response regulator receiver protein n=1 Tax=Methylocella silvestris (strain DSM 15510 / CIP 108128 / LMG 27833 / NCIMB 13906 / BL2) TaxID=395965 RepID=B8EMW2_METSB|nr:response regulator [Methylocella silvestris]ACK52791.1 response regulator receiver protein [Methylocella silvestris BL2]
MSDPSSDRRPPRQRLLVADDAPPGRAMLAEAVRRLRPAAELINARNADEALGALAMQRIDVVLIDFSRPGADGVELAALMRRTRRATPIAIVSSQGDAWMRAQDLQAVFLQKPISDEALAAFLARAELQLGH